MLIMFLVYVVFNLFIWSLIVGTIDTEIDIGWEIVGVTTLAALVLMPVLSLFIVSEAFDARRTG